jgi:hypothetical protein
VICDACWASPFRTRARATNSGSPADPRIQDQSVIYLGVLGERLQTVGVNLSRERLQYVIVSRLL